MPLEQYLQQRWDALSTEAKQVLGLSDPAARVFIQALWTKQYYEALIQGQEQ